jgi:cytochrome c2
MTDLHPTITAKLASAESMSISAEPSGKPGHYAATLTFPKEGSWKWSIQAFTMDQPMPVLNVASSNVATANQPATKVESQTASITPLLILRALVFGIALAGLALAFQRKNRLAGALGGLCLLVGAGTFMTGMLTPNVEAQGKESSEMSIESSAAQVELGRGLFIAKGCITCHYNNRAADRSEYWTIEMGAPDLSNFSASPEILSIRLKDPAEAKSDTKMPNLGLKKTEIEALIAFINSK